MEKFAVDLDKVLDELEYNEDRAETLMTSGGRRHISPVSPSISQDRGAASLHGTPHVPLESGDSSIKWRPKTVPVSQKTSVSGVFSSLNEYLNSGRGTSHPGAIDEEDFGGTCSQPSTWSQTARDKSAVEEKPDLIDASVLRPSASVSTIEAPDCNERQIPQTTLLPDIATAGTFANPPSYEEASASFDLISHKSNTTNVDSVDLEVNKNTSAVLNSFPPTQNAVISFGGLKVDEDINDDDLNDYLSDLEREELEQELSEPLSYQISAALKTESGVVDHIPSSIESHIESQNVSERVPLNTPSIEIASPSCHVGTEALVELDHSSSNKYTPKKPVGQLLNENTYDEPDPNKTELNKTLSVLSAVQGSIQSESSFNLDKVSHFLENSHSEESCLRFSQKCIESPSQSHNSLHDDSSDQHSSVMTTEPLVNQTNAPAEVMCGIPDHQSRDSKENLPEQDSQEKESHFADQVNPDSHTAPLNLSTESDSSVESAQNEHVNGSNEASELTIEAEKAPVVSGSFVQEYFTPVLESNRNLPLTVSISETSGLPTDSSSPATPPTVPVTPTLVDPPVLDEFTSSLSTSSTPFMTPTAGCSESSPFVEDSGPVEEESSCISSTSESTNVLESDSVVSDMSLKPVRPSSLEIPVRTEPAQVESAGSSEESPVAFSGTVGPPGATPCANRPSIAESLPAEPQGTDESATESSIEEGVCGAVSGAVGGEEPAPPVPIGDSLLGKEPPFWVPDADAPCCMQCDLKFTVIKRRHHCRACGKVLCSKCCSEKAYLDYINAETRVCLSCKSILIGAGRIGSPVSTSQGTNLHPNPNNPMEYCSTVPPLQQVAGFSQNQGTPTVMVPVGVLKREGSTKPKSEAKQVMFSDGIRPGADLAELDGSSEPRLSIRRTGRTSKRVGTPPGIPSASQRTLPPVDSTTLSYVPHGKGLPPIVIRGKDGVQFEEDPDHSRLMAVIKDDSVPPVKFTINRNLYMMVKILNLDCCVNRVCWCFTSDGLSSVGQDEIVIILEVEPEEVTVPKDIFIHLNTLYLEAAKGNTVTEMGHTLTQGAPFLGSREHGGFLYVRPTFQCLHRLILPPAPYLVGVLIHKWETPWARVFPIRLMLRLGAEFRYYPCPLVSIRQRSAVYGEIGHTIIQVLADFRNMVYTLPTVRGLLIHMEDKQTTILLPRNRYDQVMRALNNSNDHVLAFGANFSQVADSHLVCMQSDADHSYHTQAINIHNKPRKVTGASFVVFNGALKVSCGMAAKSTIVEDGLMVKVTSETMASLQSSLRDMKDLSITCGPINGPNESGSAGAGILPNDEVVLIKWADDDRSFNIGVLSSVDGRPLDGVPSIRVHNGTDYHGEYRFIRWTEVFILESEEGSGRTGDPVDISRLSEQLAKATCLALVKLLDLLAAANLTTLAVRATIHPENVGYQAGSNGEKLPPIYMNSLDDELVPVLHEAGLMSGESPAVLELVFRIMESG